MGIVYQKDKRSGLTYVYESVSYWDREKKQSRSRRQLIGRLDEVTGQVVPTDGRGRRGAVPATGTGATATPADAVGRVEGHACGSTALLDEIGRATGLIDDLKASFPRAWREIQDLTYYLVLRDRNAIPRFWKWDTDTLDTDDGSLRAEIRSRIVQTLTAKDRAAFFSRLQTRLKEVECLAFEISSAAGITELLRALDRARAEDAPTPAPLNMALITGERTGLPLYCEALSGTLSDAATIKNVAGAVEDHEIRKFMVIPDRGVEDIRAIARLYQENVDFIAESGVNLPFVRSFIREIGTSRDIYRFYDNATRLFMFTRSFAWSDAPGSQFDAPPAKGGRVMHVHLYFSQRKHIAESVSLTRHLEALKGELKNGRRVPEHEEDYARYFHVRQGARGPVIELDKEAVRAQQEAHGFFVLLSSRVDNAEEALAIHHKRDFIEKVFCDVNDIFALNKSLSCSGISPENTLFITFLALFYIGYITIHIASSGLTSRYTLRKLFNELDIIEYFQRTSGVPLPLEIRRRRDFIYRSLGLSAQTSS